MVLLILFFLSIHDLSADFGIKRRKAQASGGGGGGGGITGVDVIDEGTLLNSATSYIFTGAGVTVTSPTAKTVSVSIPGSAAVTDLTYSTRTMELSYAADAGIFIATATFGGTGLHYTVSRSTFHIVSVQFALTAHSTVGATMCRLAYSTVTALNLTSAYSFITNKIEITTGAIFSVWTTPSTLAINAGQSISVHITDVPLSGSMPTGVKAIIQYWEEKYAF